MHQSMLRAEDELLRGISEGKFYLNFCTVIYILSVFEGYFVSLDLYVDAGDVVEVYV